MKKLFVFIIAILGFSVPCKGVQDQGDGLGFKVGIAAGAAATAAAAAAATKAYNWYYSTSDPDVLSDYTDLDFDSSKKSNFYYLKKVASILNELYKNPDCGRMSKKDKLDNILCSIYGCKNQEKPDEKLIAIFNKSIEEEHKKLVKKIEKYLHYFEDEKVAKMTKFIIGERFSLTGKDFIEILGDPEQYELKEVVYIKYLILEEAYKQVKSLYTDVFDNSEQGFLDPLKTSLMNSPYTQVLSTAASNAARVGRAAAGYLRRNRNMEEETKPEVAQ